MVSQKERSRYIIHVSNLHDLRRLRAFFIMSKTLATITLRNELVFELKPVSAWVYFLFNEKVMPTGSTGASRGLGAKQGQQWLFEQCYLLNGERLDAMKLTQLQLTLRESNQLLNAVLGIEGEITIKDEAEDYTDSKHLVIEGKEYELKDIPWEAADDFYRDLQVSAAQAYKNLAKRYFRIDGERITEEMFTTEEPEGISMLGASVIFSVIKKSVA